MSGESLVWADAPQEEDGNEDSPESEAHGDVDESFAARRLRRWIKGMFGGPQKPAAGPDDEPGRKPES